VDTARTPFAALRSFASTYCNVSSMSISFWLYIERTDAKWVNVLHVTDGRNSGQSQGTRRPAFWIIPNSTQLHLCMDTTAGMNHTYNTSYALPLRTPTLVTVTYSGTQCRVFLMNKQSKVTESWTLNGAALQPGSDWNVYLRSFFGEYSVEANFFVSTLRFFNRALTQSHAATLFNDLMFPQPENAASSQQWAAQIKQEQANINWDREEKARIQREAEAAAKAAAAKAAAEEAERQRVAKAAAEAAALAARRKPDVYPGGYGVNVAGVWNAGSTLWLRVNSRYTFKGASYGGGHATWITEYGPYNQRSWVTYQVGYSAPSDMDVVFYFNTDNQGTLSLNGHAIGSHASWENSGTAYGTLQYGGNLIQLRNYNWDHGGAGGVLVSMHRRSDMACLLVTNSAWRWTPS
jgi:hypothetical protein